LLRLALIASLALVFTAVGLTATAIEPVTHHGVPMTGITRVLFSTFIGFTICVVLTGSGFMCYMFYDMAGDVLKGIAKRL